jgi:hypothetical protein
MTDDDTGPQLNNPPQEGWRVTTDIGELQEGWLTRGRLGKGPDRKIQELGPIEDEPDGKRSRAVRFYADEEEWWRDGTSYEINSNPAHS